MKHIDGLSRQPVVMLIDTSVVDRVKAAQRNSRELEPIFKLLESGEYDNYFTNRGCLFKVVKSVHLLVVPRKMHNNVIRMCHEQGHFAQRKTEELIQSPVTISINLQLIQNWVRILLEAEF